MRTTFFNRIFFALDYRYLCKHMINLFISDQHFLSIYIKQLILNNYYLWHFHTISRLLKDWD